MNKVWVHRFHVSDIPKFQPVWDVVRSMSLFPDEFDIEMHQDHIRTDALQRVSASLDEAPSAEMLAIEKSRDDINRHYAKLAAQVQAEGGWSQKNGVVKFKNEAGDARRGLLAKAASEFFGCEVSIRGNFLYPPGGFKEWHTNQHDEPGWRMYIIDVDQDHASWFRYIDPDTGKMETLWDEKGIINIFRVDPDKPLWHCIKSETALRWSQGLLLPDDWRQRLGL